MPLSDDSRHALFVPFVSLFAGRVLAKLLSIHMSNAGIWVLRRLCPALRPSIRPSSLHGKNLKRLTQVTNFNQILSYLQRLWAPLTSTFYTIFCDLDLGWWVTRSHLSSHLSHSLPDRWDTTVDFTTSFLHYHSSRLSVVWYSIFPLFPACLFVFLLELFPVG